MTRPVRCTPLPTGKWPYLTEPMPPNGYFIDANLLVLHVVGDVGRDLIQKHKRSKEFTVEDYETLLGLLNSVDRVFVTPNTLTETSNLLAQHGEPERSQFFDGLRALIQDSREVVVASAKASANSSFNRLGLTDTALLEAISASTPLVTTDFDLFNTASKKDPDSAVNFAHLRNL